MSAGRKAAGAAALVLGLGMAFGAAAETHTMPMSHDAMPMQDGEMPMSHGDMPMQDGEMPMQQGSEAEAAYRAANERMHEGMAIEFTGDADVDFARGMIPHHTGAIEMARAMLEHGEDPELRALAEEIIAAQEAEIAFLETWLEKRGE